MLRRGQALHDLLREGAGAHPGEEVVGHLDGDVGVQKRDAHVCERVVDLLGVELPARTKLLEGDVEAIAQRVEHA